MLSLVKQPQAIFGLPSCQAGVLLDFDRYLSEVATVLKHRAWDSNILELLDLVPQLLLRLGDEVEMGPEALPALYRHMHVVLQAYQRQPNPQLEELIQLSPEYSFHLLAWVWSDPSRRTSCPATAFKQAMLPDPYWAISWQRRQPEDAYHAAIVEFLQRTREIHARSAWTWHLMHARAMTPTAAWTEVKRLLPLLLPDPQVCLNVLETYPGFERRVLFRSALRHPDYLLAWARRFPGEFDPLVQRELLRRPAWLVEYIAHCRPGNAKELLTAARAHCHNEWLRPWLDRVIDHHC